MNSKNDIARWLRKQDTRSLSHRSSRLGRLLECGPLPEAGIMFHGGPISFQGFEEARLAFINGLYVSVPMIVLAFIELELCGRLYAAGFEAAKDAPIGIIQAEAQSRGLLTDEEINKLNKLRAMRNSLTHFRPPLDGRSVTGRQLKENDDWFGLLKADAEWTITFMYEFVSARG
jgi:hypothetical protein